MRIKCSVCDEKYFNINIFKFIFYKIHYTIFKPTNNYKLKLSCTNCYDIIRLRQLQFEIHDKNVELRNLENKNNISLNDLTPYDLMRRR